MLVLDNIEEFSNGKDKIELPDYHIGHLSLSSKTQLTLCYLPSEDSSNPFHMDEIVISPIKFESWDYLWRINASFSERQGLVNSVLEALKAADLSVLQAETVSVENRSFHQLEIVVDARRFIDKDKDIPEAEHINSLERRLVAYCIHDLALNTQGEPMLKVRKMKGLHNAYNRYCELQKASPKIRSVHERSYVESKAILLPHRIKSKIAKLNKDRYLLVSDTKERILRVFLPNTDAGFTLIRIIHKDTVGVLAAITQSLSAKFDIITSLTKIKQQDGKNHIELILSSTEYPGRDKENERRAIINDCLKQRHLSEYALEIGYPEKIGKSCNLSKVVANKEESSYEESELLDEETSEIIKKRFSELNETQSHNTKNKITNKRKMDWLRKLNSLEQSPQLNTRIFVSFDFNDDAYFNKFSQVACQNELDITTGKSPGEKPTMREAIIDRINQCDCFMGIWTKRTNGEFSPWLLWELGVAQALHKPFKLLMAPDIDPDTWQRINPEANQYTFHPLDFEQIANDAIASLLENMARHKKF